MMACDAPRDRLPLVRGPESQAALSDYRRMLCGAADAQTRGYQLDVNRVVPGVGKIMEDPKQS